MKRALFILTAFLFLVACGGNQALSGDFQKDVEQVLPIIEEARESKVDYSEQERELLSDFSSKYEKGQYIPSGKDDYYEMNDIEKAILREVNSMRLYAIELEVEDESLSLASETKDSDDIDLYKMAKEEVNKLMKISSVEDLPEDLVGKYPTYEVYAGMYPEQFIKDTKELLRLYDPIINGTQSDITDKEYHPLIKFLEQYQGENAVYSIDYEQDGKYYLTDGNMRRIIDMFNDLSADIHEGALKVLTTDEFNSVVELVDRTDI